ncbi:hypothetical protein KI387_011644, partial [Taxus chinensis]
MSRRNQIRLHLMYKCQTFSSNVVGFDDFFQMETPNYAEQNPLYLRRVKTMPDGVLHDIWVDIAKKRPACLNQGTGIVSSQIRLLRSASSPVGGVDNLINKSTSLQDSNVPAAGPEVEPQGSVSKPKASTARMTKNNSHITRSYSENVSKEWCPAYATMSIIGRRDEMEDTVAAVPCFYKGCFSALHFFGVYDGHGGCEASVFCKERLHVALAQELRALPPSPFDECGGRDPVEWEKVMKKCFIKMDIAVGGSCPSGNCCYDDNDADICCQDLVAPENVGSTAVVAVVSRFQIVVANCGDSRAVLCRGGKALPFSKDHKPQREDEMDRIEAAGGKIIYWHGYRVGGFLALSRALGDRFLKQYVISEPEVTCTERREEDEFLILASDGLWDVVSNELACEVARKCLAGYRPRCLKGSSECSVSVAAALLTRVALARGSTDNISVVVIDLKRNRKRRKARPLNMQEDPIFQVRSHSTEQSITNSNFE